MEPHIKQAEERYKKLEQELVDFDFSDPASDQDSYRKLSKEFQKLQKLLQTWEKLQKAKQQQADNLELLEAEEDPEFREVVENDLTELNQEITSLNAAVKALLLPSHPNEERNSIVEIRPAAGGDEAGLFAGDLYRMYGYFAERKGWRREVLAVSENAMGGLKHVAFSLQGDDVFSSMGFESGVHRVQRVPETESGGRIHTSTVTVAVLPEAEEVDVEIRPEDIRFDVFRSSGPGGQSVNTTDSAVRVTHLPTGITVSCQQEKSQHRNKDTAMRILRSHLFEKKQAEEAERSAAQRRRQVGTGDRSERIRTYNFPQSRVTDHRYGITSHELEKILNGELEILLDEIREREVEQRLAAELT
ncbi:MAG: peptide chain release factor 1 [Verrucomicrobiota bacterium]